MAYLADSKKNLKNLLEGKTDKNPDYLEYQRLLSKG
jgi:hypothetical protein